MIPKKIHYCWFGRGEKPKLAQKCIASWKTYMPDYEIIEWNEDNFDVNLNGYTKYCYENKMWAYLSDFVRLYVVCKYGGLYFDTDVEVIKPFDSLLQYHAFFCFENNTAVASGLGFGSEAEHPMIQKMVSAYDPYLDGAHGVIVCTKLNTKAAEEFGFFINGAEQEIDGVVLLPADFLNPMSSITGEICCTENTLSIHRYSMSAFSKKVQIRVKITRTIRRLFGVNCFSWLKRDHRT